MIEFINNSINPKQLQEKLYNTFKDKKYVQVDTETEGFDPHTHKVICWQVGDGITQYVIEEKYHPLTLFKYFFEDTTKVFLFQNAKFDLRFFIHNNIFIPNIYDTFLAECILTTGYNNRALALDDLVEKYCEYTLDKSIRAKIHIEGLTERVIKYSAEDVMFLERIMLEQLKLIKKFKLEETLNLENEAVKVFAFMEYNGVLIDRDKWLEISKLTESKVNEIEKTLDSFVLNDEKLKIFRKQGIQLGLFGGKDRETIVNWASNAQKVKVLKALGLNMNSVAERELKDNESKHEIIKYYLDYAKYAKLVSSFGKSFLTHVNKVTGRVHPNYWQILSTGRISVKDPNVNQIPSKGELGKEIRSAFIPKKGYKIVGGDYSGMELRIIAEFSKDPTWVNAFKEDKDLHSVLCAMTFGISEEEVRNPFPVKPDITYRDVQKTINFGLAYGMSEHKLSSTIQVSVEEARDIINRFFAAVPKVKEFLDFIGKFGVAHGFIRTARPIQRIRWFPEHKYIKSEDGFKIEGSIERRAKNTPIQGTNGDIIKLALSNTQNIILQENLPVKILLSVYDEIQTECEESYAEIWKERLNNIMIDAAKSVIKTVPVVVDCKINNYWTK